MPMANRKDEENMQKLMFETFLPPKKQEKAKKKPEEADKKE